MAKIPLTQNRFAIVDSADFDWLNQWKWYALKSCNTYYACRKSYINGKKKMIAMHRTVLGLSFDDGKYTDHINSNGLDNRRSNLRICTIRQNQHNQRQRNTGYSRFKGVCRHKFGQKWLSRIKHHPAYIHLGSFDTEEEAARAYDKKAKELFGEFAKLNFPEA